MVDFHMHMGIMHREEYPDAVPLGVHQLIDWMKRNGVEVGVLLPLESPEGRWGYFLTEEAVRARDMYPERFVAFACVDPRYPRTAELIDYFVTRCGCRGFGEHVNGLAFDDELNKRIYAACNEHALPLDFEINTDLCWDEVGLPRLESCLKQYPNVTFVGHGPAFWTAISAHDPRGGYPKEPIEPGGALDRVLAGYDNLYADLSAMSGYNAMTRDPDFSLGFIERHWRKLLWGTDILRPNQALPHVEWLRTLDASPEVREAIGGGNARRLLGLDGSGAGG